MSDKSLINSLAAWWRGGAAAGQQGVRTCPLGHPMDPNWETCPRCAAEQRSREKTVLGNRADGADAGAADGPLQSRRTTIIGGDATDGDDGSRSAAGPVDDTHSAGRQDAPVQRPATHDRRLVAVLASFSANPKGQLFPLYEGRNVIGSGTVESEGGRPCDVQVPGDRLMSNEHAMILYRVGRYTLEDSRSTNGTFLNDTFVEGGPVPLPDGARIKTGATVWLFRKIVDAQPAPAPGPTPGPGPGPGQRDPNEDPG